MRELKFRGWATSGSVSGFVYFNMREDNDFAFYEFCSSCGADNIEQYTGFKDKNGKEIYEGDIVHYTAKIAPNKSSTYEVYYDQLHAMYALSPVDGKIDVGEFYGYIMRQQYEIIGNIHENPKLLEDKK